MSSNQRARLVLNPLTLVALLLVVGVAAGASFLMFRRGGETHRDGSKQANATRGGDIVLSSEEFDFGTLRGDRTVVRQLLLRNHGATAARLRIDASGRVKAEPASLELATDAIGRVFLSAGAGEPGPWEEEIRVIREDSPDAPMVVKLRGSNRAGDAVAQTPRSSEVPAGGVDIAYVDAALPGGEGDAARASANAPGTSPNSTSAPAGSVQITRTGAPGSGSGSVTGDASGHGGTASQPPGGFVPTAGRMSDRPVLPTGDDPEDGEEPSPIRRKTPAELDKKDKDPEPDVSALAISSASSVNLMGTTNVFTPQQVVLVGSANGGSFSLLSPIQIPRIPLAFGQSVQFSQRGSAVGSFDAGSGQVVITIAIDSLDSTGHSAPFTIQLTTGTVVARNTSGVLVSATGQARQAGSGQLRLVGIGKIPEGFNSGAELELVTFDVIATLQFATPSNDSSAGSSGG